MRAPTAVPGSAKRAPRARMLLVLLAVVAASCAPAGPRPMRYGQEQCEYCRMTITDARFGGQVVSRTGKVQAFDAVECLADYVAALPAGQAPVAWVTDFAAPGTFIPVEEARFVHLARASSPMGAGLAALRRDAPAGAVETTGAAMTWTELLAERRAASREARHAR